MTRVLHLKRTYLRRTETFVYSQLAHLQHSNPIVLARDLNNLDRFPYSDVRAFCAVSRGVCRTWSDLNYSAIRRLVGCERRFYLAEARAMQPDLLHAHFAVDAAYFIDLKRTLGLPLVVSCYGYDVSSFPKRYLGFGQLYLRRVWDRADLVLAMSVDMHADLIRLGCAAQKIRVHYHGIDLSRFPFVERNKMVSPVRVLFVGTLTERKGVEILLRAFAELAGQRPNVNLCYVGSGPLALKLRRLVQAWGLGSRVSFAGFVDHGKLGEELGASHIFCHPSMTLPNGDKEGIPGTIVEAMASGLPVVTTRHAGIPEMVVDGEHGFVVSERDVSAVAQSLLRLIDDPELRTHLGRQAASRARMKADVVQQAAELESIYNDIITTAGQPVSGV